MASRPLQIAGAGLQITLKLAGPGSAIMGKRTPDEQNDGAEAAYDAQANAGLFDCCPHGCPCRLVDKR